MDWTLTRLLKVIGHLYLKNDQIIPGTKEVSGALLGLTLGLPLCQKYQRRDALFFVLHPIMSGCSNASDFHFDCWAKVIPTMLNLYHGSFVIHLTLGLPLGLSLNLESSNSARLASRSAPQGCLSTCEVSSPVEPGSGD